MAFFYVGRGESPVPRVSICLALKRQLNTKLLHEKIVHPVRVCPIWTGDEKTTRTNVFHKNVVRKLSIECDNKIQFWELWIKIM